MLAIFKNLPKEEALTYWPFVFQTICNLISNGICAFYNSAMSVIRVHVSLAALFTLVKLDRDNGTFLCFIHTLMVNGPMYSTGFAMIAMASQRFILVKRPFIAQQILSMRFYVVIGAICTVLPSALITLAFVVPRSFRSDCREMSFYNNRTVRAIADPIIFYLTPVIICLRLYISVGVELWKEETQVTRNRELTILFLASCITWIVLWFPTFLFLLFFQSVKWFEYFNGGLFWLFLMNCHTPLFHLFSAVNPIIFILCYKYSQSPLKAIFARAENNHPAETPRR